MSDDLVKRSKLICEALRSGSQCDEDGVMCIVSRQACHEGADRIEALERALSNMLEDGDKTDREEAERLLGRASLAPNPEQDR